MSRPIVETPLALNGITMGVLLGTGIFAAVTPLWPMAPLYLLLGFANGWVAVAAIVRRYRAEIEKERTSK